MTSDSAKTSERAGRYLTRVLQINPLENPQQVLDLRRRALGLTRVAGDRGQPRQAVDPQLEEKRQAMRGQVQRLQSDFWTMPLDRLRANLDALDARLAPELRPTIARLRTVATCRSEFPRLATVKNADLALVRAFKLAVVKPAAEAGPMRERFLNTIKDRKRLQHAQRMTRVIRDQYPILFQLEKDWFETILKMKRPRAVDPVSDWDGDGGGFSFNLSWTAIILVILFVRLLIRVLMASR